MMPKQPLLWISFGISFLPVLVLAISGIQTTSTIINPNIYEKINVDRHMSLIEVIENALIKVLLGSKDTKNIYPRISIKAEKVLEIEFIDEKIDELMDDGYISDFDISDNEVDAVPSQSHFFYQPKLFKEKEVFQTLSSPSFFNRIYSATRSFVNEALTDTVGIFGEETYKPLSTYHANDFEVEYAFEYENVSLINPMETANKPYHEYENIKSHSNMGDLSKGESTELPSKAPYRKSEGFSREKQTLAPRESYIGIIHESSKSTSPFSEVETSTGNIGNLETYSWENLYEEISDIDLEQFLPDEKEEESTIHEQYNPMKVLESIPTNLPVDRWQSFLDIFRSIAKSGSSFLKAFSGKSDKNEEDITDGNDLKDGKSGFYLLGHAAWTKTNNYEDHSGFDGGLDHNFISVSNDGTVVSFGITDGFETEKSSPKSRSLSKNMCRSAQLIYEAFGHYHNLNPGHVMKMAFKEALSNPNVAPGSTSAIFGTIYGGKYLDISFSRDSWLAIFRNGAVFHETNHNIHLEQNPGFSKMHAMVKNNNKELINAQSDQAFSQIQQKTWSLEKGDVVLAVTDGLTKRLNKKQIEKSLNVSLRRGWDMMQTASALVETAIGVLQVDLDEKPFWVHSPEKEEDIMVIMIEVL